MSSDMAYKPIFEHFWKKCIYPFENPKTLRKISENWCWRCKISEFYLNGQMCLWTEITDALSRTLFMINGYKI